MQYVCAGDLRALDCLTNLLNYLKTQNIDIPALMQSMSLEDVKSHLGKIIGECMKQTESKPKPVALER
ncbi:fatty acid synthase, partial [Aspergillus sclerotialis]